MNDECACISIEDYDPPGFWCETTRTARKPHKCCVCWRKIQPGEKYEHVAGKWEGKISTFKTCADCQSLIGAFFCGARIFGEELNKIGEHIQETEGQISADCLLSLTPCARDMVFEMIEELWEELDLDDACEVEEAAERKRQEETGQSA